jgi:hypothetical protein
MVLCLRVDGSFYVGLASAKMTFLLRKMQPHRQLPNNCDPSVLFTVVMEIGNSASPDCWRNAF